MRKVACLVAAMLFGAWYAKGGFNAGDDHARMSGLSLPTTGVGQGSELMTWVASILRGHAQTFQAITNPAPVTAMTPTAMKIVAGSPGVGSTTGGGPAKGPDLIIPPELLKFVNPSLLTTTPAGTQDLSPAARQALWQIISQARANPAAFKEQYAALKALHGQQ